MKSLVNPLLQSAALPLFIGLIVMYGADYAQYFQTVWYYPELAHVPFAAVLNLFLFFRLKNDYLALPRDCALTPGIILLTGGLFIEICGQLIESLFFVLLSQIPVIAALILLTRGWKGLKTFWFPLLFMVFMLPLPTVFVTYLTSHLKEAVSGGVENLLYALGYPIGRHGVVIAIGQYQLLVSDACSGLYSMVSLSALGAMFIFLQHRASVWHNGIMVLLIIPVAVSANLMRVLTLVLMTYYLGDSMTQRFHDVIGILVFAFTFLAFMILDKVLGFFYANHPDKSIAI
jgi:exosortase